MKRAALVLCLVTSAYAAETELPATVSTPTPPHVDIAESLSACRKLDPDKRLKLTLHGEVGASELIAALAPLSCRPIVLGGSAPRTGKVAIDAPDLLTPREAIDLLVSALDSIGLSLEESGAALRVVDSARGKEIASMSGTHGREAFLLRLVRLTDGNADEIATTLGKLRSKDGEVQALPQGHALLLIDRAAQVERMEALAHALDRPLGSARMYVLPTHRSKPSELLDAVEKIALGSLPRDKSDKPDPNRPTLIAVDAARVLLFSGGELAYRRVEALLERIDPPLLPGEDHGGRIAVFYLKHANAEDIAAVLKEVFGQARATNTSKNNVSGAAMIVPPLTVSGSSAIEGDVKLTADKEGNALVVSGSVADLESVRELVARLDTPRRQVYVECTVLDVSADLSRELGIAFSKAGATSTSGSLISSSSSSVSTVSASTLLSTLGAGGLVAGVLGQNVSIAGQSLPSFGVVLSALESSQNATVLSRPHLLTLDHKKATISVGQKIPFLTSTISAPTSGSTIAQQGVWSREDVALKFELTPHLADDDDIRLEIKGEIQDVTATSNAGGPITNQRTIETTVVVRDGETVVLGGLTKDSMSDSVEKVPYLGDIPLLGKLFQTKSKKRTKTDLLIVLTPYVIRDETDLRHIYNKTEAERRELSERTNAFTDPAAYDSHVDYTRKRGLLEEINTTGREAEEEGAALEEARRRLGRARPPTLGEVAVPAAP